VICPNYFRTMGIPLLAGRDFNHQDVVGAPGVIIVNEMLAQKYWPKQDAVGKRVKIGQFDSKEPWMTIVGVAGDVHHWGLDENVKPEFFRPYPQAGWPSMTVIVRTASAPSAFGATVKEAMTKMDPDHPISNLVTMEEVVHDSVGSRRFPMLLLAAFGFLALALAAVGIGGVVSYAVVQRTHEIGIRMAMGAEPRDVLRLVVGGNMAWALAGVGIGVGAAIWLTRLLTGLLYGVQPGDRIVLGAVCLVLTGVALIACYVPARRAARVDPVIALRFE
jgi:putative ABC transport system permease protein